MRFEINNEKWKIKEISNAEMIELIGDNEAFTQGVTEYKSNVIYINKETPNKRRTLYHELTHLFMYEYGHNQFEDKKFNNEDVCEICANSHDIIHKIVEDYFKRS